ncbi:MAG: hypothetical protein K0R65_1280 [Crocinitomicaceae bacterium]|jgi:hypothetical protein|nr:hypothetical protein [Crocinitomicaceae bacterium]
MPDKLLSPAQVTIAPNHVFAEQKPNRESDDIGNEKSGNMRFHRVKPQVEVFFFQHIMKRKVIEEEAQKRIAAAAGNIIIRLLVHKPSHQRVKEIQDSDDEIFGSTHAPAKVGKFYYAVFLNLDDVTNVFSHKITRRHSSNEVNFH